MYLYAAVLNGMFHRCNHLIDVISCSAGIAEESHGEHSPAEPTRMLCQCTQRAEAGTGVPPMYSLPAPLNGIFVLTMLTKTPTLSVVWLILYEDQLMRFSAVFVMTSDPPCRPVHTTLSTVRTRSPWATLQGHPGYDR